MEIRKIKDYELNTALDLVWKVFIKYEAPDYGEEGVEEFRKSVWNKEYLNMLEIYAAFDGEKMVGVIATRSQGTHIALFFVDGEYHRQGIGKALFNKIRRNRMTVNSSPYAQEVYHHLGFRDTKPQQSVNSILFTPMEYVQ